MNKLLQVALQVSLLFTSLFALQGQAGAATQASDRVAKAVEAMGGPALQQLKSIAVKAKTRHWEPNQSYQPGGEMRFAADSTYTERRDLGSGAARIDWVKDLKYPSARIYRYSETVAGGVGYVSGIDSGGRTKQSLDSNPPEHTMSANRFAATVRELQRSSPTLLADMAKNSKRVQALPDQAAGAKKLPAVKYTTDAATFIVTFDPASGLPERVRTRDYDPLYGDTNYDLVLSDWRAVGGIKYPHKQQAELAGKAVIDIVVEEVTPNPALAADVFAVPERIRARAPKAVAANQVPYQWYLRRQFIGNLGDVDTLFYSPESGGLKLVDRAPGVSHTEGGSHNTLLVEMEDYLVAVDAPIDERMSKWVIAAAAKKYPGKPIKYLALTHHHMDHSSGVRSYVAAGATLVVGKGAGEFFRKALTSPDSLGADSPKKKFKPEIIEVESRWFIGEGKREVALYLTENPHATSYLIAYVPDVKLGFVTDLWSPGRDPLPPKLNPGLQAVVNVVNRWGLQPEQFAGGHGTIGRYADLAKLASN